MNYFNQDNPFKNCPFKEEWLKRADFNKFKTFAHQKVRYQLDWSKIIKWRQQGKSYQKIVQLTGTRVSRQWIGYKLKHNLLP